MRNISWLLIACLFAASPAAGAHEATANITINGKSVALTHGRAWHTGTAMGIPDVEVYFAEQDLAGMKWWEGYKNFEHGQRGVVLKLHPSSAAGEKRDQASYRYVIDKDAVVATYAADCHDWNEAVLDDMATATVSDFTVTKNSVTGKVEWHGHAECPASDPAETVTAWSAQFSLPLEEVGEMPAQ